MSSEQRTVLIVDDREENRYTVGHALKRAGFLTLEATTGQEGLELSRQMPDVVILDVRLPDILGFEVCRRLRANPQTCHIPVLQLSATFQNTESKLYALESGADAYLMLPVDPLILVATIRSLVRLHDAEKQAQVVARQWAATFDALSEGVALIDRGHIQRCNRRMTELLRTSYRELEQTSYAELLRKHLHLAPETLAQGAALDVQVESRFFRVNTASLSENDSTSGSILIVADITPQKQAEQALLLNERLAATGRMAHTIAHEINNPLEAVTNLIYLAQQSPDLPAESEMFLATAAEEVQRISQISRQVLSFHREASTPIAVPLGQLVRDVIALSDRVASGKGISFSVDVDDELFVNGFPARLRQVFSNIVRNALEASGPTGDVIVRVRRNAIRSSGTDLPAVRVTIADRGTGIAIEHRARIFEAFYTTKAQKGSGVGLWLSQAIVQEHSGKLQVRTCVQPGRSGTAFSVLLPLLEQPLI